MPAQSVIALGSTFATGRQSLGRDLSTIIDGDCVVQLHISTRRNKIVQVDHRAVFPQKRARAEIASDGLAYDLTSRINSKRLTEAVTRQGSEIRGHPVLPEVRVERPIR